MRAKLTRVEPHRIPVPQLFAVWQSGKSIPEMAAQLHITVVQLYRLAKKHKLPDRPAHLGDNDDEFDEEPTAAEKDAIEARKLEVRAAWPNAMQIAYMQNVYE